MLTLKAPHSMCQPLRLSGGCSCWGEQQQRGPVLTQHTCLLATHVSPSSCTCQSTCTLTCVVKQPLIGSP